MAVNCWGTEAKDKTKITAFGMKCFKCTAVYKRMIRTRNNDILNKLKKKNRTGVGQNFEK
jgi:hypothetical protein